MSRNDFVFEIIHDDFETWIGNELYKTQEYAEFCAEHDYMETYYSLFLAGYDDAEQPGVFTWELVTKALYQLYEDSMHTGIFMRVRHVNSLEK